VICGIRASVLSTQYSELGTRNSEPVHPNTGGSRPAGRLPLFACPKRESRKRAPRSWPACGGFPPLRDRRAGGKDSLRSGFPPVSPVGPSVPAASQGGENGIAIIKQFSSASVLQQLTADAGESRVVRKSPTQRGRFGSVAQADSGCRLWRQS
jgi:hypothetical protein